MHHACEAASSAIAMPSSRAQLVAQDVFIRSEATRLLKESAALSQLPPRELCRVRWLFYQGDENYGLGNVLYDVSSAAALALSLNRTLIYGIDEADRKFGTLLHWPGILTMKEADELRRKARCGAGALATRRHVQLAPDRCTFHRTWRKERSGSLRCFKRLLGVNWLAERAPLLELSKVHAFSGLQTLLRSAHEQVRRRVARFTGGCVPRGQQRVNVHGALLATLMRPAPPVLHAVGWALTHQQPPSGPPSGGDGPRRQGGTRGRAPWATATARPTIALHVRAMSDHRARNASSAEQSRQVHNGLQCVRRALQLASGAAATGGGSGGGNGQIRPPLSVVVVSSSPELRAHLVRRINARARRDAAAAAAAATTVATVATVATAATAATATAASLPPLPPLVPFVFDWRRFMGEAPREVVDALAASESAAAAFCAGVNATESFRCNRSAHLRDWGPEPHWVAVVELLLVAAATHVVVGAGSPYFKVCNTFTQVGAALADAAPPWLHDEALGTASGDGPRDGGGGAARGANGRARGGNGGNGGNDGGGNDGGGGGRPRGVRLLCASRFLSTDWGSSMWRTLNATGRRGSDYVVDCGAPACLQTPLQPELWAGLHEGTGDGRGAPSSSCSSQNDPEGGGDGSVVFGQPVKPLQHGHH